MNESAFSGFATQQECFGSFALAVQGNGAVAIEESHDNRGCPFRPTDRTEAQTRCAVSGISPGRYPERRFNEGSQAIDHRPVAAEMQAPRRMREATSLEVRQVDRPVAVNAAAPEMAHEFRRPLPRPDAPGLGIAHAEPSQVRRDDLACEIERSVAIDGPGVLGVRSALAPVNRLSRAAHERRELVEVTRVALGKIDDDVRSAHAAIGEEKTEPVRFLFRGRIGKARRVNGRRSSNGHGRIIANNRNCVPTNGTTKLAQKIGN